MWGRRPDLGLTVRERFRGPRLSRIASAHAGSGRFAGPTKKLAAQATGITREEGRGSSGSWQLPTQEHCKIFEFIAVCLQFSGGNCHHHELKGHSVSHGRIGIVAISLGHGSQWRDEFIHVGVISGL